MIKGFPPLYRKSIIRYSQLAGAATQTSPKEKERKRKRNKCQQRQINETKMHPPEKYHHAPSTPKRRVPSNAFKKEATTTPLLPGLVLGFPPVRRGGGNGGGCTRRPSGRFGGTRRRRRVRAGRAARGFSR
uniref:Uncharacterized protein n=1 Tax=Aegilops tauschii subsp. strangulata TaxID=200361 RepID=A0A453ENY4_AEGTS